MEKLGLTGRKGGGLLIRKRGAEGPRQVSTKKEK